MAGFVAIKDSEKYAAAPLAPVLEASHVAINVADLDRSVDFYRRALGLRVIVDGRGDASGPSIKGLIADFAVEIAEKPGAIASRDVCLSFSVSGIEQIHQAFRAAGYGEAGDLTGLDGARFFFIRDPDGNTIELIELPYAATTLGQLLGALARNSNGEN